MKEMGKILLLMGNNKRTLEKKTEMSAPPKKGNDTYLLSSIRMRQRKPKININVVPFQYKCRMNNIVLKNDGLFGQQRPATRIQNKRKQSQSESTTRSHHL